MNIFLAKWPNGTITFANAANIRELFNVLETEGAPEEASIYKVEPDENGRFHLSTDIVNNKIKVEINLDHDCKLKLRKNLFANSNWDTQFS